MNFISMLLFTLLAVCNADEDSAKKHISHCLSSFFVSKLANSKDNSDTKVTDCLTTAMSTYGEEEGEFCYVDNLGQKKCSNPDYDYDVMLCMETHREYILACMGEEVVNAVNALGVGRGDLDRKAIECAIYGMMFHCVWERSLETCGEKGKDIMIKEMIQTADIVENSCTKANKDQLKSLEEQLMKKRTVKA